MAKLFAALENEEIIAEAPQGELEQDIIEQTEAVQELKENVEGQVEATEVGEVLERIESAETDVEKVEIAKEHLLASVGYSKKYSMESFQGDLNNGLAVAQEGFFSRIGNAFNRLFTTNKSFNKRLQADLAKLEANGSKEELLVDPSWSKYLIASSNKEVTAPEVIAFLKKVDALVGDKEINKYLSEIAKIYDRLASELTTSTFIADKKTVENINQLHKDSETLLVKFENFVNNKVLTKNEDNYPDYQPIVAKQAKSISDLLVRGFTVDDLNTPEYKAFERAADNLNEVMAGRNLTSIKTQLTGYLASDVATAANITTRINDSIYKIIKIVDLRTKMAHSALRYIEASSK